MNRFQKYIEYIKNTGGSSRVELFDDDWKPIGPMVRRDMHQARIIYEKDGKLFLYNEEIQP